MSNRSKGNLVSLHTPLTADAIREATPSVFAGDKRQDRGDKYTFISTAEVLRQLATEGFQPFAVTQKRVKLPDNRMHTKHVVRLRHESVEAVKGGAAEVLLWNAHDGTSAYIIGLGWLEFVCANGLIIGSVADAIRVPHKGDVASKVIDATYEVVKESQLIADKRDAMLATPMRLEQQDLFAHQAMTLRYGADSRNWPFNHNNLTVERHAEQAPANLWNVFNRVQESVIRGGLPGVSARGRRMRSRPVTSLDRDRKLNMGLWDLAEQHLQLAA